jgi:hypothetical protein
MERTISPSQLQARPIITGLYAVDGAAITGALVANPSLTTAHAIKTVTRDEGAALAIGIAYLPPSKHVIFDLCGGWS